MRTKFEHLLQSGRAIIADGGMGTMLFDRGLLNGDSPELWNVEHPDKVRQIHQEYVDAGAQIILTNTFGGNRIRLGFHSLDEQTYELNRAAVSIACEVAAQTSCEVAVAGSIGPTGSILEPYGDLAYSVAVETFEEQAQALLDGDVDVFWIETMSALEEVVAAIEGCRRVDSDFPIVVTMTFDTNGHTMMGVSPEKALETLTELGVVAMGANCGGGTQELEAAIKKMSAAHPSLPLVAKSNAGMPHLVDDVPVYDASPEDMGKYAARVRQYGASIIGACCGSTPDHIRAIAKELSVQSNLE